MPVWPHLLCLDVEGNYYLGRYQFEQSFMRFPSLTSLTTPSCDDASICNLVQLPALEELRFPAFSVTGEAGEGVLTSTRGFGMLSKAAQLRAIYYSPPEFEEDESPSLTALTSLFALARLTRITIPASWSIQGVFCHNFEQLRCLELEESFACSQTDELLMPLVKPLDVVVAGRQQRQVVRAAKRGPVEEHEWSDGSSEKIIPAGNAANFPSLECLALPYRYYNSNRGDDCGWVSAWMMAQLRRSYEYEVPAEWEAECTTLGAAELLKVIITQV